MEGVKTAPVMVGRCNHLVVIRLNAPATAVLCVRLKKQLSQQRRPEVTDLYFDLSGTPLVDSTFVGMLLSMAVKRNDPSLPTVHLLRPSPGVRKSLESMHVCQLLDCCEECSASISQWHELPAGDVGQDSVAGMVIDAHERLIEADERNVEPFSPVLQGFRARRQPKS